MAERVRLDTGIGMLGDIPDILLHDGKISEETAVILSARIRDLIQKINRNISFGNGIDGYRSGNLDGQFIDVVTAPAVAGTEFLVIHGLKRVPVGYILVRSNVGCAVYDSSVASWTDSIMYLKCSMGSATLKLLVF